MTWRTTSDSPIEFVRPSEPEPLLTEQKMFGGLAFLIGGNMAVATSGKGGALIRVDPANSARLITRPQPNRC
jgi:hypothetical protein